MLTVLWPGEMAQNKGHKHEDWSWVLRIHVESMASMAAACGPTFTEVGTDIPGAWWLARLSGVQQETLPQQRKV